MAIDADTTAVLSYDPKENKLDIGLTLRVEEENIVSTVDVVVNCAKLIRLKSIQESFPVEWSFIQQQI